MYSTRRNFLQGIGTAGAVSLAGCTDLFEDEIDPGHEENTPTATSAPKPEYELNLSLSSKTIDLSNVYDTLLNDFTPEELAGFTENEWQGIWQEFSGNEDGLRDQDYLALEYTVTEHLNGEEQGEIDPENVELEITGENSEETYTEELGPELDNAYTLACTQIAGGENTVTVNAEINGETVSGETGVEKILPEGHFLEAIVDDTRITSYNSPFLFDTHQLDTEQLHQQRVQAQRENTSDGMPENTDTERLNEEVLENDELSEKERKRLALGSVGIDSRDITGKNSALAETQASNEEIALREHTDYEEVFINGFDNPIDRTAEREGGNHGTKAAYIDGDWYHHETRNPEVAHLTNLEHIDMVDGSNEEYVSILAEFEEGQMEELSFERKMDSLNQFFASHIIPNGGITSGYLKASDGYGYETLQMMRNNEERSAIMTPLEVAADHHLETGKRMLALGTPEEPVILAIENKTMATRLEDNPDFQDVETVVEEALS